MVRSVFLTVRSGVGAGSARGGAIWSLGCCLGLIVLLVAPPARAAEAPPGEVFDFCYMKIPKSVGRSHKQRLVLFRLAGRDVLDGPEREFNQKGELVKGVEHRVFRDVGMESHARSAFLSAYLLKRFYTVEAEAESPALLRGQKAISDRAMIEAAAPDGFAAYSLACADWVVMPRVREKSADFKKVKKKKYVGKKEVEYWAWDASVTFTLEADLYKRAERGWTLAATVEASNGGLLGTAFVLAAAAPQRGSAGEMKKLISKRPEPGCKVPLISELSDFSDNVTGCSGGIGKLAAAADGVLKEEANEASPSLEPPASLEKPGEPAKPLPGALQRETPATKLDPAGSRSAPVDVAGATKKVATEALAGAADGMTVPTENAAAVPLSAEERALLASVAAGDEEAAKRLAKLGGAGHPKVLELAATAQGTLNACTNSVDTVANASEKLRALSQQGPAAIGVQAVVGLAGCAGARFDADLSGASAPGTDQSRTRYCRIDDDTSRGVAAMRDVAVCQGRIAMERAALALQKEVKQVPGIKFQVRLQALAAPHTGLFGLALGDDEGVQRGDLYVAVARQADGSTEQVGFGRVQLAGPGGERGEREPSHFRFRSGTADAGVSVEEHAQIGVPLGLKPLVQYYLLKGDLETTLAFGGALEGGYNATRFVPFGDEVWGRASIGVAAGTGDELFLMADLVPEVQYYLAGGLAFFGSTGFSFIAATKEISPAGGGQTENATGFSLAVLARLGLDYAITPDWNARLSAAYRQGLRKAELENDSKTVAIDGGTLSAAEGGLSAGYTF